MGCCCDACWVGGLRRTTASTGVRRIRERSMEGNLSSRSSAVKARHSSGIHHSDARDEPDEEQQSQSSAQISMSQNQRFADPSHTFSVLFAPRPQRNRKRIVVKTLMGGPG